MKRKLSIFIIISFILVYVPFGSVIAANISNWFNANVSADMYILKDVIYKDGKFIAKDISIKTSSNGSDWETTEAGGNIAANPDGKYLVVREFGQVYQSIDMTNWTQVAEINSTHMVGIAYGNGKYVAIGDNYDMASDFEGPYRISTYISEDGKKWTTNATAIKGKVISTMMYGGGKFVAYGRSGDVLVSTDGVKWTQQPPVIENSLMRIRWINDKFIALGEKGVIWFSSDAVNWEKVNTGLDSDFNDILWDGEQYIAGGSNGAVLTSADGKAWTMNKTGIDKPIVAIVKVEDQYYAYSYDGTLLKTSNGKDDKQKKDENQIKVIVNGKTMNFAVQPIIADGSTLVPMRAIFEELGMTIDWDGATKTVTATGSGKTIKIVIDSKKAQVNGVEKPLVTAAKIVNGNTLVPLRFIAESLGADVQWVAETRTVIINSAV